MNMDLFKEINKGKIINEKIFEKHLEYVNVIEKSRGNNPQKGDMVEFTDEYGTFCKYAHIDKETNGIGRVCTNPYIPFLFINDNEISFSTSGGYWVEMPLSKLKYKGQENKYFNIFNSEGSYCVIAKVNVWEYSVNQQPYSTKTHNRFFVSDLSKKEETRNGYKYLVSLDSSPYRAFKTKKEFEKWIDLMKAQKDLNSHDENHYLMWGVKEKEAYLTKVQFDGINEFDFAEIAMTNGNFRKCKRKYIENTLISYFDMETKNFL